jgi:conjugative relaxase-like TrwC/TraI family protein
MISAGSAAGVGYYAGGGGSDEARDASGRNYYTGAVDHGERPGTWSGGLADALGLRGEVRAADMAMVYEQFVTPDGSQIGNGPRNYQSPADRLAAALAKEPDALPERVEEIRLQIEQTDQSTCRGVDLTFSVPKSVSVAYVAAWRSEQEAISDGRMADSDGFRAIREAIDGAILDANAAAMDYVATLATTRTGKHGAGYAGQWEKTPGLVVASFPQLTSRADDPQFHVHNVVLNRGQTANGKIGALDTRDLGQQRHAYSAVADRVLAERLQDAGIRVAMRPDGVAREIVGVDQEYLDAFSQRRAQITKAMAPVVAAQEERLGRPLNALETQRLAQTINLVTREAKDAKDVDWTEKLAGWQDRITDEIGAGLGPIAEHLRAMVEESAGTEARGMDFSPEAVIGQAIHTVAQEKAAWSRADLILELDRALPDRLALGAEETVALLDRLADAALASEGVVQVAGKEGLAAPSMVAGTFTRPSDAQYAAPVTLEAENLILRASVERGRGPVAELGPKAAGDWRESVDAWVTANYPTIGADQRAAVVGLASSDAALAQLVGPAGTGKSFTAGALAGVWGEMTGGTGRVVGLAVSEAATEVLRNDGLPEAYNVAAWKAHAHEIPLGPNDIVLVDETSMIGTMDLDQIRDAADRAGARIVTSGDPYQLGAVGAGGAMGLIDQHAETYVLSDVRRFSEEWERGASLGLREGSTDALREYDVHGRLVEVDSMDDAMAAVARAAAADRLAGLSVSVTADTNADAYRIADMVREHLVAAGSTEEVGIMLARGGQVAGVGDEVLTRQIDRDLGVLNGSRFTVVGTGEDGSLSVVDGNGELRELPAGYVDAHVQLGYASTVHGAQGKTVDRGYTVTGGNTSAASLYVGMTRGRDRNTAFVALQPKEPVAGRLDAGQVKVEEQHERPSAVQVLSDALSRESQSVAALTLQDRDAERLGSMDTIMGRIEEVTSLAVRGRLDSDLDRLVEDGVLSEGDRARLGADDSTDHLSRVCRAAEQVGLDPSAVLREAVEDRSLTGSKSVAQVIAARITSEHDLSVPGSAAKVPDRVPEDARAYLAEMHAQAEDRARELGSQAAQEQAGWAVKALGPVPEDAVARLEWEQRAGAVAAFREAKGLEEADRVIPGAPGLSQNEARAAWSDAWEALGRPQETKAEAALSDGALHARVAAWEREQAWAPAHANASLRQAELDAEQARQEAILARATGDEAKAAEWETKAAERQAVADGMDVVAEARGQWAEETAVTQDLAERARAELLERGRVPGQEPDRITAEEWLEHQREVDAREDEHRAVTELDVPLVEDEGQAQETTEAEESPVYRDADHERIAEMAAQHPDNTLLQNMLRQEETRWANEQRAEEVRAANVQWVQEQRGELGVIEGEATPTAPVEDVEDAVTDQLALEAAPVEDGPEEATVTEVEGVPQEEEPEPEVVDEAPAEASPEPEPEPEQAEEPPAAEEPEPEPERSPAHDVAPMEPDDVELAALVKTAEDAQDRVADRQSEEAVHDDWEAEQTAAPEETETAEAAVAEADVAMVDA